MYLIYVFILFELCLLFLNYVFIIFNSYLINVFFIKETVSDPNCI